MKVSYRLNIFDNDGDINEEGIFIYIGDVAIIKFKDVPELKEVIERLQTCAKQADEDIELGD